MGDEEFARRLQEEEVLAAAAATAAQRSSLLQGGRIGRRQTGMQATSSFGDHCPRMAHISSTRLADEDSRALCRQLGDRGFEGTGSICDSTNSSTKDLYPDENSTSSACHFGSMGRAMLLVLREGVNRMLELPRALVTIVDQSARCAPVPGWSHKSVCHGEGVGFDEEAMVGQDDKDQVQEDCSNDAALARAMQEQEWLEARR